MKAFKTVVSLGAIAILTFSLFSACGTNYTVDISNMPAAQKEQHEKLLKEYQDKYDAEQDEDKKAEYASEIGFRYMNLGQYGKAIKYYKEVLAAFPSDYTALTNLSVMCEEVGEIEKALEYQQRIYENDSLNPNVIARTIKLLAKNYQFDDAVSVLETFAKTDAAKDNVLFISDQFSFIQEERNKAAASN